MPAPTTKPSGCFHCGLPLPEADFSAQIGGEQRAFCCPGCRSVCQAIYDAGLEGFYQRTPEDGQLAPPPEVPPDLRLYDLDEVQAEFVPELAEVRDIHLLVEGIHCAACVWLIERSLMPMEGVLEARVNLSARRLHLRWDNRRISLSRILQRLAELGYRAVPYDPEAAEGALKRQNRDLLFRMAFAGFAMMNLLWVSIALYSGADKGEFRDLFYWVGFALATPTLFYSGWPFLKGAASSLRNGHLGMDLPIAIGATVTWAYSVYVTLNPAAGEVYYDTVVNFLFVILVGRHLESLSRRHAVAASQRLLDLQPRVACVLRDGEERIVPVRALKKGERVLIKAGERIPVDGCVCEGRSRVDESMLSGESRPMEKQPGERVSAGTLNLQSALTVEVEGTLRNTALGRIITLVEDAQASKAPIQCTADRIVPWFVATTLLLAALTFAYWSQQNLEIALLAATSVLIITCPCAFGLATPMSIAVAAGLGARNGILVKNGAVLETLSSVSHFVFDKTGTLTEGTMSVKTVLAAADIDTQAVLRQLALLESRSEHSIARAIVASVAQAGMPADLQLRDFHSQPGCGVRGCIHAAGEAHTLICGTLAWLREQEVTPDPDLQRQAREYETQGMSCVHVARDGRHVAVLVIADRLREQARALIDSLRRQGARLTLLTGDRRQVAEAIAAELGGMEVIAEVLPQDKDAVIRKLQAGGAKVAMIGDGINDAPALIRADVGMAIGSGTDVSMDSADIVLMHNDLLNIGLAIELSRRTLKTIRQNIAISFAYNSIMVPLAMMALITPLVAAVSMPVSSLLVIGNAARIRTLFNKH